MGAGKDQQWRRRRVVFKRTNWKRQRNNKAWDPWAVLVIQCGDTELSAYQRR